MKNLLGILILSLLASCSVDNKNSIVLEANDILNKCISVHDPESKWEQLNFSIHIQEPRISNPSRYSTIKINNENGAFELIRNREDHQSKHTIDDEGTSNVYLDGNEEIDEELIEKFRLNPERNTIYKNFYGMMYGLPMSLNPLSISEIGEVEMSIFNNQPCYRIPILLKEEMFSKNWIIYISEAEFEFKGMDIVFPDDHTKGERLFFEQSISINGIHIPRVRHWYELSNNTYSGSDIIVNQLLN